MKKELTIGLLDIFPNLREKVSNHSHNLMEFEDYLIASGVRVGTR